MIGASFSISVFFIIMLVIHRFNFYGFSEDISNLWIWLLFYGYGILCAFLIDLIRKYMPHLSLIKQAILYIFFGYLIFFIVGVSEPIFMVIAGTIGAFSRYFFGLEKKV